MFTHRHASRRTRNKMAGSNLKSKSNLQNHEQFDMNGDEEFHDDNDENEKNGWLFISCIALYLYKMFLIYFIHSNIILF